MAKHYTQEIHQVALKRHFIEKQTAAQIGRDMRIPYQTIGAWINNYGEIRAERLRVDAAKDTRTLREGETP